MIRSRRALLAVLMPLALALTDCSSGNKNAPNPTPSIASIFPDAITAGSENFNVDITGQGFIQMPVTMALWNGSPRTTTFNVATGHLVVTINASDVTNPGIALVTVMNPSPGGGTSAGATFTVKPLQNGAPTNIALDPASVTAGTLGPFKLTVNGLNFVVSDPVTCSNSAVIRFNGTFRQPTTCSTTSLTTDLTTTDLATSGFAAVWVDNPLPGGIIASSTAVDFMINGSKPANASGPRVVSVNALGGPANGRSTSPAMSADGRFVAFVSSATNLLPMPSRGNVFVRDTCLGAENCTPITHPVDIAADGSAPDGRVLGEVSISADGRFVAFASLATNLVTTGARNAGLASSQVFVRDTCLGSKVPAACNPQTWRIAGPAGVNNPSASFDSPSLSADGRFVAFRSVSDGMILMRDTCQGVAASTSCVPGTVVLASSHEVASAAARFRPQISPDGRFVVFDSTEITAAGTGSVFLADSCFGASSDCLPKTIFISSSDSPQFLLARAQSATVSSGGRFVVFRADMISGSDASTSQRGLIFLRDTCIGASEGNCALATTLITPDSISASSDAESFSPQITADGRFVSFTSVTPGVVQGFVRDTCFGATVPCSPRTAAIPSAISAELADGKSAPEFSFVPLSADGRFAAFFTLGSTDTTAPVSGSGDVFLAAAPIQ